MLKRCSKKVTVLKTFFIFSLVLYATSFINSAETKKNTTTAYVPKIANASNEAEQAIKGFRIPKELKIKLFAAEPLLANPVGFCIDGQGKVYVAETFRQRKNTGAEDNRSHPEWKNDDIAAQTVQQRIAYMKKHLGKNIKSFTQHHDRIRLLEDRNGDGVADRSTVFADGFNKIPDGTGASLLTYNGNVYYTCIPNLWQLRDTNHDGKADQRKSLHYGYGVRFAFRGHDLHGLRLGPDGKIYFSIGDRGYNISTAGKQLKRPDTGAVFRCNPDGSQLEEFAYGMRNPQDLAFDEYGNLFTGDNNSDSGDRARWVYVVEGGDTGWRMYYQYFGDRGPWNREKLWHLPHTGQPAYVVPPVSHLANGPSGLTYYPGTGMDKKYKGHFFLCEFRGGAGNSGVYSYSVKPKGASFEIVNLKQFIWSMLATDVEFGPDGNFYLLDWVNGWEGLGKGRIYRAFDPNHIDSTLVKQVKSILHKGVSKTSTEKLANLLKHEDQRVRQLAQFELAKRQDIKTLQQVANDSSHQLARIHAIWAIGQVSRMNLKNHAKLDFLFPLIKDSDPEIRAQVARMLSYQKYEPAGKPLLKLLSDSSLRVRSLAALAIGRQQYQLAFEPLLKMLRENDDQDAVVRHAAVMGLVGIGDEQKIISAANDLSTAVRMGLVLTLRRLRSAKIAKFLDDPNSLIVDEAARAIYDDKMIPAAIPKLASLIHRSGLSDSTIRRVLSANLHVGTTDAAKALADFAGQSSYNTASRVTALSILENWTNPSPIDRVHGRWNPLKPRKRQDVLKALEPALGKLLASQGKISQQAAKLASQYGIKNIGPALFALLKNKKQSGESRAAVLSALLRLKDQQLEKALKIALVDSDPILRIQGRKVLATLRPKEAVKELSRAISNGKLLEQQAALDLLANMKQPGVDEVIQQALENLLANKLPQELALNILEAAQARNHTGVKTKLAKYNQARDKKDALSNHTEALTGGNADLGKKLFFERTEFSCVRCHSINKRGGLVGPDLSTIAKQRNRRYLLESIIKPSAQIAKGFESVKVTTEDGLVLAGVLKEETKQHLKIITPEGKLLTIDKEDIDERSPGISAMPEDLAKKITKRELRDLVEYLSSLK